MLRSIAHVLFVHKDLKLICTGLQFNNSELQKIEELKLTNQVVHIFCQDLDMLRLYKGAKALIFPSLYEGFGIPILEAYATNCPLIINKKSCFPEIAGNAAVYFNLDKEQDNLGEVLEDFLYWDKIKVKELLGKQQERVKLFTWEKAANKLSKVYQEVLANK